MIIDHKSKFVIFCPTKTGMMSVRSWGRRSGMEYRLPQHGMSINEIGYNKILLVRDPYDRFLSMYSHLRRWKSDWGHRQAAAMDLSDWAYWWRQQREKALTRGMKEGLEYRAPWRWILSFRELDVIASSDLRWKTEELDELPSYLGAEYSREMLRMSRVNTSIRDHGGTGWRRQDLPLKVKQVVNSTWAKDTLAFGYVFRK